MKKDDEENDEANCGMGREGQWTCCPNNYSVHKDKKYIHCCAPDQKYIEFPEKVGICCLNSDMSHQDQHGEVFCCRSNEIYYTSQEGHGNCCHKTYIHYSKINLCCPKDQTPVSNENKTIWSCK